MKPLLTYRSLLSRLAVVVFMAAGSTLAHAHAHPSHQLPSAGSTVTTTQNTVAIDFDEGVEPAFSSITVTDALGKVVSNGKAAIDPANNKHLSVALNPLAPGIYAVAWVAVATDGHRTQGHYTFTVK